MDKKEDTDTGAIATAAAMMAHTKVIMDTSMSAWSAHEQKVRVRVNGVEHSGTMTGFDGERLLLVDDLRVPTLIYLNSGVAIIGPQE